MKWIVRVTVLSLLVVGGTRSASDSGGNSRVVTDFEPVWKVSRASVWDDAGWVIHNGFLTGNTFRERTREQKLFYVMGYHDAMMSATMFGAPLSSARELIESIKPMDNVQVLAIVDKYLDDHPERWHYSMNALLFEALREVCGGKPHTDSDN